MNLNKITPDPLKDQFFLEDKKIIQQMISTADLSEKDTVLEIGAGTGNLTKPLAEHAGTVIAYEIDQQFEHFLSSLPQNVKVHYENAWEYVQLHGKWKKKKQYNKIVSNPPYSFIEPLLHNLTFLEYDKVILLVPKKTLKTIATSGIFSSFFEAKVLFDVPKKSFNPVPDTNSVVIDLTKLPDPIETKNPGLYLRQYVYQHEGQLVKNSLMEGIIKYSKKVYGKDVTKNQARKLILESKINKKYLNDKPQTTKIYEEVGEKFKLIPEAL